MKLLKKLAITGTIRLNWLWWFGYVKRRDKIKFQKVYYIWIWKQQHLRGRPRNKWQNEVREDGRIVSGEGWQEKIYNRNWRSSSEWQGIITFCTCQWNESSIYIILFNVCGLLNYVFKCFTLVSVIHMPCNQLITKHLIKKIAQPTFRINCAIVELNTVASYYTAQSA
jgi:hypothetical protein